MGDYMTISIDCIVGVQDMDDPETYRIGKVKEVLSNNCFKVETKELIPDGVIFYNFIAHKDEIEFCRVEH